MPSLVEPVPSSSRNPGIDLLRGLAIFLVVLHHIGLRIPLKKTMLAEVLPTRLLSALNFNGYQGVFVFFVISGFLIAGNSLRRWGSLERIDMRAFYARRFARIAPCLLVLLAVLSVLHLLGAQDYVIQREGQSLHGALLSAFGLYLNWYEGLTGYLPGGWDVLWSLSIEEAFYVGFPVACLLLRKERVLLPLLLIFAMALPWFLSSIEGNEVWKEKAYLPGMAAIALGVAIAIVVARWTPKAWVAWTFLGMGVAGLITGFIGLKFLWPLLHDGVMLLLTLSTALTLMAMHWRREAGASMRMRGLGWLRRWGQLSYEIYLTHMFVVTALVQIYKAYGENIAWGWLWYVPALPACWLLGTLVERWVSVPSERWLKVRLGLDHRVAAPSLAENASA
ncbi:MULTISPECIES: acyltransferase family protein [Dyella]|uniref:acyltransferase family protein n=1 Tax=Dyella TaxID=231454 RepID=UPI001F10534B|nr:MULTISPECIES: acyltransferase [Dyella]